MKTNPVSRSPRLLGPALLATCAFAMLPSAVLAQASVREERAREERIRAERMRDERVPAARDVRVVDSTHALKRGDRAFIEKAAKTSMSEVSISRVAASRTSNPEVRRFAQMMIEDHESAIEQLTSLAGTYGVSLPAKDPRPEKWEKRDAKNFDREYLEQMIDDHENVVKAFEKHAKDGEDPETVAYARKHLPKMQQHLQHAIDLKRALTDKR
jgi:putative membrane protein